MSVSESQLQVDEYGDAGESEYWEPCDLRHAGIKTIPSDYNVKTLVDTIEDGLITIPGFQRKYVWNKKLASKLIESIIIGLPIPQIFFYEKTDDELLVIDGQQRLMSIYYFVHQRFPKDSIRTLPKAHKEVKNLPLDDDSFFADFRLQLPELTHDDKNPLNGLSYSDLDASTKARFDRRPIRTVTITQKSDNKDTVYEVFNRLNSGVVLRPQEIRRSLFDSKFYEMLYDLNLSVDWRRLYGNPVPDKHMRDTEILLRGFALLENKGRYRESMVKFLNSYSDSVRNYDSKRVTHLMHLAQSFLTKNSELQMYMGDSKKFSTIIFECAFVAACERAYRDADTDVLSIAPKQLKRLKQDKKFKSTIQSQTTGTANVNERLDAARRILAGRLD